MIIRVRTPKGMHRVPVEPETLAGAFKAEVAKLVGVDEPGRLRYFKDPQGKSPLDLLDEQSLGGIGIKHGDMVFAQLPPEESSGKKKEEAGFPGPATVVPHSAAYYTPIPSNHPVDIKLAKTNGLIHRPRDPQFCRHGDKGMCDYCSPLEPYDPKYLAENAIKHASFHAHLRQLMKNQSKTSDPAHQPPPLEEPDFRVKVPCPGRHEPWPKSICSKCQPSAVTLNRQSFRMVDHLEVASPSIIEHFLEEWRTTGAQRFGFLYGRYQSHPTVPLGIKAEVYAIYEPFQKGDRDWVEPLAFEEPEEVRGVAEACGFERIGMIWTDLVDDGTGTGKVLAKRHPGSYFLSAQECTFAATMQRRHPFRTPLDRSGHFGSRFVTCVVSGNEQGAIELTSYQVSLEAEAMVESELVIPTQDPSQLMVEEATATKYVPEVFYTVKDKWGVAVRETASPAFPVEYWLITLSHGFPTDPTGFFNNSKAIPVERDYSPGKTEISKEKDMSILAKRLLPSSSSDDTLTWEIFDFFTLVRLYRCSILTKEQVQGLAKATINKEDEKIREITQSPEWNTLQVILQEIKPATPPSPSNVTSLGGGSGAASSRGGGGPWSCPHCTFTNEGTSGDDTCEMCGLPREG